LTSSKALQEVRRLVREGTPPLEDDRYLHADMRVAIELVRSGRLLEAVQGCGITLPSTFTGPAA
jgi:histidine ammonia-lyase